MKVTGLYWTFGSFDGVIIAEAPDEEAVAAAMLSLSAMGNVLTTTSRAFEAAEIEKVIGLLGKK